MAAQKYTEHIGLRVNKELKQKCIELSEELGFRSVSQFVELALENEIRRNSIDNQTETYSNKKIKRDECLPIDIELANQNLDIAIQVKELRNSFGLSQKEFATRINQPELTIARIESGMIDPSVSLLTEIAFHFNRKLKIEFLEKNSDDD